MSHTSFDNYSLRYNDDELNKGNFIGTPFLVDDWRSVELIIHTDTLQYSKAKFNVNKNVMELKVRGEDLYIEGGQISQFRWKGYEEESNSIYRPNLSLVQSDLNINELLRTTSIDNIKLLSSYWVVIKSPSSETPNLGGSVNEGRIKIHRRHFRMEENDLISIKKLKDLSRYFNIEDKILKKIVKSENLNIDKHVGLSILIQKFLR